mmetsp:Transcript_36628/g.65545  ORF Transcript_36628/g.65545 Transcript_36628/m.65545 type:complete len:204 (-) Transcript_36628:577-1188(-)
MSSSALLTDVVPMDRGSCGARRRSTRRCQADGPNTRRSRTMAGTRAAGDTAPPHSLVTLRASSHTMTCARTSSRSPDPLGFTSRPQPSPLPSSRRLRTACAANSRDSSLDTCASFSSSLAASFSASPAKRATSSQCAPFSRCSLADNGVKLLHSEIECSRSCMAVVLLSMQERMRSTGAGPRASSNCCFRDRGSDASFCISCS